jgi:GNAT superfamily N-acetyltransferase
VSDELLQAPAELATLARAVLANWETLERYLVAVHGGQLDETASLFRFTTGLHTGFLNGILRADDIRQDLRALIEDSRRHFAERQVPWRWMVGGTSAPGLADRLQAAGLERRWEMPGMAIDLEAMIEPAAAAARPASAPRSTGVADGVVPEAESIVAEVLTPADLEAWLSVRRANLQLDDATAAAWRVAHGRPGLASSQRLRHFTAWTADRPVANATLFLGAGVAGIYHVDTLPESRGRGFGTAVTLSALGAARTAGTRYAVLSASALGEPIYRRLGFVRTGHVTIFVDPTS